MSESKTYKVAIVGYGPAFNMGKLHADSIIANEGFEIAAVVDPSKARQEAAQEDFPGIQGFDDVDSMLAKMTPDLTVIITPHNTHAELATKCLAAGSHVVVEKPMAITTDEIKEMLAAAEKSGVVLSTFHNRRWDKDFVVLKGLVESGVIGRVFRIDAGMNNYRKQRDWWRSDKEISGGAIYDWGAHFTDWMLAIVPDPIKHVTGFQVKHGEWDEYNNEDHSEMTITFKTDCVATLTISHMSAIRRPRWVVRGEKGSIVSGDEAFTVTTVDDDGRWWSTEVRYDSVDSDWHAYYKNVCEHIRDGARLEVTPESAGRVICALHAADVSAHKHGEPVVPHMA